MTGLLQAVLAARVENRSCLVIVTIASAAIYPVSSDDGNRWRASFATIRAFLA
jgi:hypothetical protein